MLITTVILGQIGANVFACDSAHIFVAFMCVCVSVCVQ